MEECATQYILVRVGGTAEGEVIRPVRIDGIGCLQVEGTIRQCYIDRLICGRVPQGEGDRWVQILQLLMNGVVDEVHAGRWIPG